MKEGRKPEYPEKTPGDELQNSDYIHWCVATHVDRLLGLVVKVSALRVEDPGFKSRLRQDFSGSAWCQYTVSR